jgi:hypothetical protein
VSAPPLRRSLFDLEPTLIGHVAPEAEALARRALIVRVLEIPAGPWKPEASAAEGLGHLITGGLLTREVTLMGARSVEPLGPGDLLRPWQEEAVSFVTATFTILAPVRMAILDRDFATRAGRFPGLFEALVERALLRSRFMAVYTAIDGLVGVHRRISALMWTLAERWGVFDEGEVFLPVELHHAAIAGLVAARRPSVSTAIARLQREGTLERVAGGWILRGDPPAVVSGG